MKIILSLIFVGSIWATVAGGAERPIAEIVDYGIYTGGYEQAIAETNAPTGQVLLGGSLRLEKQTTKIPARLGNQFGFRFVVHGKKEDGAIGLHFVYLFPEITDKASGKKTRRFDANVHGQPEDRNAGILWTFTDPSELVAGEWIFQVFRGQEKILEKRFDVVNAEAK